MKKYPLTAKVNDTTAPNGCNVANRKRELIRVAVVYGVVDGEIKELAWANFYAGKSREASTVYCDFGIRGALYRTANGKAGGYGYEKKSAALGTALTAAGVEFYGDVYGEMPCKNQRAYIAGVGESAIESALLAVGKMAFPKARKMRVFFIGG